ncbi:MAG: C1 family peptidase [Anaerolineae bacterium]|nr:protease inhibitor I42 family protein [Thermoflexales bacterium]MDW8407553.1 C1 family peptidase [Anaerolineae bacterium]
MWRSHVLHRAVCALALTLMVWPAASGAAQEVDLDAEPFAPPVSGDTQITANALPTALDIQIGDDGSWRAFEHALSPDTPSPQTASLAGASLDQLAEWLHDAPERLFGRTGVAMFSLHGQVTAGESFILTAPCNPSTGFVWQPDDRPDDRLSIAPTSTAIQPITSLLGSAAICAFAATALANGEATLSLVHRRPWLTDQPIERQVRIAAEGTSMKLATLAAKLGWPLPNIPASQSITQPDPPQATAPLDHAAPAGPASFPRYFNWCDQNKCPPIRNQGWCGSCWAFATVGAMESAVLIARPTLNPTQVNFSEQFLVSCNRQGWGCNGGWWGHHYHTNLRIAGEPMAGPVGETAFPYQATDAPCNGPYLHRWQARAWNYVRPSNPFSVPSVDELKQAILQYGPVAVAVNVGSQFAGYTGGVFTTNEAANADDVNHGVVLVGWNEDAQAWILRNSWGVNWGLNGYMLIRYGVSNVGYGASYVNGARLFNRQVYFPVARSPRAANGLSLFPIADGDFERQVEAWYNNSGLVSGSGYTRSGNWAGWLRGFAGQTRHIYQPLTVPPTATLLRFWRRAYFYPGTTCGQDSARIKLGAQTLRQYNLCALSTSWVEERIDVQAWRGQRLTLTFEATTNSSGAAPVVFILDDVAFIQ